jgi:hypothetical protein
MRPRPILPWVDPAKGHPPDMIKGKLGWVFRDPQIFEPVQPGLADRSRPLPNHVDSFVN